MKQINYDELSDKLKALGHPIRLQIVHGLIEKNCCVSKICDNLHIPQATISRHLSILKNNGIVDGKRDGNQICYRVVDNQIKALMKAASGGL